MKKLEKLTKEQEDLIPIIRDKWINIFNNNTTFNDKSVVEGIEWLYNFCKLEKPKVFIMDNPLYVQLLANLLANKKLANVGDNVWANVGDNIRANVVANVRANVGANVRDNVGDNVWANVRANVWANVGDNVWDNVRANVWANVGANVWANIRANVWANVGANVEANVGANVVANVRANVRANVGANVGDNVRDNVVANVRANVVANVGDNVVANVGDNVRANVVDNVWANVGDNVWANVWDNVVDNVWDNVWDNVVANVVANVGDNVGDNLLEYITPSDYINYTDAGFISFHDYFTEIGINENENFNKYKNLMKNGIYYSIFFKGVAIVSKPPKKVVKNQLGRLHNLNDYAIEFDGYSLYFYNGINVPVKMFNKLKENKYTFEDFTKEKNEELKNVVLSYIEEKFGSEELYRFISSNLKEIDTYVNKKEEKFLEGTTKGMNIGVYTLFKGNINNIELAYVRCYCPSTDRMFFLGVEPKNNNAKDAIASLYRIPEKLVKEIKYIQRQGERFTTFFTDKGNEILEKLSKEEVENLIQINGEDYFKFLTFEF